MILSELVLHNFGVYAGRQVLDLTPEGPDQPIIVIGALNGGGKTTLLHALQLVLYGKVAPDVQASRLSYDAYLKSKINGAAKPEEGVAVQLSFVIFEDDGERHYTVTRTWKLSDSGRLKEDFHVTVDGQVSQFVTENWADHMEALLPSRIMPLFFFDGEKIEDLANSEQSAEILSSAVSGLLGLDLIDQLEDDLDVLERRKRKSISSSKDRERIEAAEAGANALERRLSAVRQERAGLKAKSEWAAAKLKEAQAAFASQGGELFEKRHAIGSALLEAKNALVAHNSGLADIAANIAPLLLVKDLLSDIRDQADAEAVSANAEAVLEILAVHDEKVLGELERQKVTAKRREALAEFMTTERRVFDEKASHPRYLKLSDASQKSLHHLLSRELEASAKTVKTALRQNRELNDELDHKEKAQLAIPADDRIQPFIDAIQKKEAATKEIDAALLVTEETEKRLSAELKSAQQAVRAVISANIDTVLAGEDASRILIHSARVRETLAVFRGRILNDKLSALEALIVDCYDQLTRKSDLLASASIDPTTFELTLKGGDWSDLNPRDLSAGERQLLAIAILWGLSKASQRRIPAIIDTPLGRLDSTHRETLGSTYFPHASHQVILLSTDEEVDEDYLEHLSSSVSRTYLVEYNPSRGGSEVRPGYLF